MSASSDVPPQSLDRLVAALPGDLRADVATGYELAGLVGMRVGGRADLYMRVRRSSDLARAARAAHDCGLPVFVLGAGTNICVSDLGVRGLVLHNQCRGVSMGETAVVETGAPLYSVFVAALQSGLSGLEFAVGIPGTVGGALVSNAGAYRHSIGDLVSGLEVIRSGELCTAPPDWMDFGYRDTRLRRQVTNDILARVTLRLVPGSHRDIRARAADYQRQRIRRQPWYPSCGSFFKNITDRRLAESLPELGAELRDAGVVPAGLLIASTGCKALAVGGAQISGRHANFIVNRGGASASDVRRLADTVRSRVFDRYGVALTEEVLYIGDWRDWPSTSC